jgi:ABC-type multidrug transport system fused ATPase/permease subunit
MVLVSKLFGWMKCPRKEGKKCQKSHYLYSKASVARSLIRSFGTEYALIGIYKLAWAAFTWLCAYYFLQQTLLFIQNKEDYFVGHMYAMSLFISALLSSVFIHQLYGECARIGIKVKAAVSVLIYRKSLRLSRVRGGAGEVINILSTDLTRVNDLVANFHFLWSAFVESALIIILSFLTIGISTLPALGFVLILTPIQMYLGKLTSDLNRDQTSLTTERVHLMSEILTAIKLIKFYAWEKPFSQKISEIREKELNRILRGMIIKAINFMVVFAIPVWAALTCLGMYVGLRNTLTAAISFTVLSLFNTLRYPFFMLPMAVRSYSGAITAFERLDKFMHSEEVEEVHPESAPENSDVVFEIKNADFKWDGADTEQPTLQNINLVGRRGMKIAVIGDVGSGKSSLIAALLGQIRQVNGDKMKLYGNVSFSPQQAWLLNETLRENILFGTSMNRRRYKEVIRVCSLQRDLSLLVAGDQTELAERGANLSGGQRQRTSLARAVYHDSDLVLLDDPISAVDQHVGRHIFEECFLKFLKNKTCVISLHQLQYLPQMDWVVVMKNGKITMQGTYSQLMAESEDFSNLINNHVASGEQGEQDDEPEVVNETNFELPDEKPKTDFLTVEKQGLTVRSWKEISTQQMSSIIERNQHTITKGGAGHDIAEIIRKNELSVYSMSDMPTGEEDYDDAGYIQKGKLTTEDTSGARSGKNDFALYFNSAIGWMATSAVVVLFALAHGIRIGSGKNSKIVYLKIIGYVYGSLLLVGKTNSTLLFILDSPSGLLY